MQEVYDFTILDERLEMCTADLAAMDITDHVDSSCTVGSTCKPTADATLDQAMIDEAIAAGYC